LKRAFTKLNHLFVATAFHTVIRTECTALLVLLLSTTFPLTAQTGKVRIQVTDPNGVGIPAASVALADSWGKTLRTLSTNRAGDIRWTGISLGRSYFYVSASGYYSLQLEIVTCDNREQTIPARLSALPKNPKDGPIIVEGTTFFIETVPMPNCETLELASNPGPPKRHWWQIFR